MERHYGAFTLLEVMLAVVLTVGLMSAIFLFYDNALATRRDVMDEVAAVAGERIVMDRITDELRSATVYPFIGEGLTGDAESMQFITTALPGPAAWAQKKSTEDDIPPEHDLRLVGYRLRYETDEDGQRVLDEQGDPIVLGLERTEQKILTAETVEEGEQIAPDLISGRIRFICLRYLAKPDPTSEEQPWEESWSSGKLPSAVEITLGRDVLPEGSDPQDYPYEKFRRVVYLPASGVVPTGGAGGAGR